MPNDFYPTPSWATEMLLKHSIIGKQVFASNIILEPCAGRLAITHVLKQHGATVVSSDIEHEFESEECLLADAMQEDYLASISPDWIVTNPPFSLADYMVPLFLKHAKSGVAILLKLSWLEPTRLRWKFLHEHPPTKLIVLPRISFDGSGQTDSVTAAWFLWYKFNSPQEIVIASRAAELLSKS